MKKILLILLIFISFGLVITMGFLWLATEFWTKDQIVATAAQVFTWISISFGVINGLLAPIKILISINTIKEEYEKVSKDKPKPVKKVKER